MVLIQRSLLTGAEEELKKRFQEGGPNMSRMPSTASETRPSERHDQLVLPDEKRGPMPHTKDKYLIKENPHLVQWEREVRKFERRLSPSYGHRISAVMIYEWATGLRIKDLMELEPVTTKQGEKTQTWRTDLRKIDKILRWYFGKPYMTYIMGRKVPKAYRVKPGYYIKNHRPMTLTLYAEYVEGVLEA